MKDPHTIRLVPISARHNSRHLRHFLVAQVGDFQQRIDLTALSRDTYIPESALREASTLGELNIIIQTYQH